MNKIDMREWVASLEGILDNKLKKWRKHYRIEDGEAIQLEWQFEQTRMQLDIFWEDKQETILLSYTSPRIDHSYRWHGLTDKTFNKVMDRIGKLAQVTMSPPIDPTD